MTESEPTTHASMERIELVVAVESAGVRLDRFLATQLPEMSRTHIQTLMEEGRVLVDGAAMKPSHKVEEGSIVVIDVPPPNVPGVHAENIPLDVLYEDADIAVINKPAGMIVHPGAGEDTGTLVAALLHRFGGADGLSKIGGVLRPGIVHRLDKETSGVIVIARNDAAHEKLVEEFQARTVDKTYIALLHGKMKGESGSIDLPVAHDLNRRARMTSRRREGREARTDWKTRLHLDGFTLIEAGLHTGRTHQIRVHFSTLGCPVVGDTLYGAPKQERVAGALLPPLERNFLHSARIAFTHPRTGERMQFRAPIAPELVDYLHLLGKATNASPASIDVALKEFL
jgi:23S rRNA pseudouridine1911/1915/1917 synthase